MNVKGIKSFHLLGANMKKCTFLIISESTVAEANRDNQLGTKGSLNICHVKV
jgi:hypothetical protein